jgi:hypothetical protein
MADEDALNAEFDRLLAEQSASAEFDRLAAEQATDQGEALQEQAPDVVGAVEQDPGILARGMASVMEFAQDISPIPFSLGPNGERVQIAVDPGQLQKDFQEDAVMQGLVTGGTIATSLTPARIGLKATGALATKLGLGKAASSALQFLGTTFGFNVGDQVVTQAAQNLGLTEDLPLEEDLDRLATNVTIDLALPVVVKPVSKISGGLFKALGNVSKSLGHGIDNMLDQERALARAFADSFPQYAKEHGGDTIVEVMRNLKTLVLDVAPDKRGEIFGPIFTKIKQQIPMQGEFIDMVGRLGIKRLKDAGKKSTKTFGEIFDLGKFQERLEDFVPGVEKNALNRVFGKESDSIAAQILDEADLRKYHAARRTFAQYEKKLGQFDLFRGTRAELAKLSDKELAKGSAAWVELEMVRQKIANTPLTYEQLVKFKRIFGKNAKYDKVVREATEITTAQIYRDLETAFRRSIGELMDSAGSDVARVYKNANTRFGALAEALPLADHRQFKEVNPTGFFPGNSSLVAEQGNIRGRFVDRLAPGPATNLSIARGDSSLAPVGELASPLLKGTGALSRGAGNILGAPDAYLTPFRSVVSTQVGSEFLAAQAAQAEELEFQRDVQSKSLEYDLDLFEFESLDVEGGRVYLDDPNEQSDVLSDYEDRVLAGDMSRSHLARQASRFASRTTDNELLPLPPPPKKPRKQEKLRTKSSTPEGQTQYGY